MRVLLTTERYAESLNVEMFFNSYCWLVMVVWASPFIKGFYGVPF